MFTIRAGLVLGVLALSGWYLAQRLQGFDLAEVRAALLALAPGRIALALGAVALAFVAVAGQERAVMAHLALPVGRWRGARAAAASAAVSQTLGFGPVLGALVRRRLLPELTLLQSFAVSAGITLGFFGGLGLFVLALWAFVPGMAHRGLSAAGLGLMLALLGALALSRQPQIFGLRKPNLFILGRFLAWLSLDLAALATAFWAILPQHLAPALAEILPTFLLALGLGTASGSPGGLGAFDVAILAWLPGEGAEELLAGILAFRVLAYLLPAGCGALWILAARHGTTVTAAVGIEEVQRLPPDVLADLPEAEAHLIRQGQLRLWTLGGGGLWLTGQLAHTRVMLGRPTCGATWPVSGAAAGILAAAEAAARSEARLLCLYKIDARLAQAARARGHAVLPVAREAVLEPGGFQVAGPERAGLRRKLSHARRAGVVVEDCANPPLAEMEAVAAAWAAAHGRERGFSMGRWDRLYAAGQRVFAARAADGRLLAFVTFHTARRRWVLDLVRFGPGTPDGTIYALVVAALGAARWHEVAEVSLAAVPLPGLGLTGWRGAVLRRCTAGGGQGLEQFKQCFAPRWRKLYIAAPGPLSLFLGGVELTRAILRPAPLAQGRRRLVVFSGPLGWARGAALIDAARGRIAGRPPAANTGAAQVAAAKIVAATKGRGRAA